MEVSGFLHNVSDFNKRTFKKTGENVKSAFDDILDWLDDSLLSLNVLNLENPESIDDSLRQTLAYIQAENFSGIEQTEVFEFLKARNKAIVELIAPDKKQWASLISSSLPLASALALNQELDDIIELGEHFLRTKQRLKHKISLLKELEGIIERFPSSAFKPPRDENGKLKFPVDLKDEARKAWISGLSLSDVSNTKKVIKICNDYYAYTITWAIGAISNKCRLIGRDDLAEVFEDLSLSCELGLPDSSTARIYLSGIRSRTAAMEIGNSSMFIIGNTSTIKETRNYILSNIEELKEEINSDLASSWLDTLSNVNREDPRLAENTFPNFTLPEPRFPAIETKRLYVKNIEDSETFLCSHDYSEKIEIEVSREFPFMRYANRKDCYFDFIDGVWQLQNAINN